MAPNTMKGAWQGMKVFGMILVTLGTLTLLAAIAVALKSRAAERIEQDKEDDDEIFLGVC